MAQQEGIAVTEKNSVGAMQRTSPDRSHEAGKKMTWLAELLERKGFSGKARVRQFAARRSTDAD